MATEPKDRKQAGHVEAFKHACSLCPTLANRHGTMPITRCTTNAALALPRCTFKSCTCFMAESGAGSLGLKMRGAAWDRWSSSRGLGTTASCLSCTRHVYHTPDEGSRMRHNQDWVSQSWQDANGPAVSAPCSFMRYVPCSCELPSGAFTVSAATAAAAHAAQLQMLCVVHPSRFAWSLTAKVNIYGPHETGSIPTCGAHPGPWLAQEQAWPQCLG